MIDSPIFQDILSYAIFISKFLSDDGTSMGFEAATYEWLLQLHVIRLRSDRSIYVCSIMYYNDLRMWGLRREKQDGDTILVVFFFTKTLRTIYPPEMFLLIVCGPWSLKVIQFWLKNVRLRGRLVICHANC